MSNIALTDEMVSEPSEIATLSQSSKIMRILQVIECATPAKGGLVQAARTTAEGLASRGHEVELWTSSYGEVPPLDGVCLRIFRGPSFAGLHVTPGIIKAALRELDRFDIVHFHAVRSLQNMVVGTLARRRGLPYVLSPHGTLPTNGQKVWFKHIFDAVAGTKIFLREAAAIAAVSDLEARDCEASGLSASRIHLTYNPIKTPASLNDLSPSRPQVIGYLGRLERSKEVDKLIAAFAYARSQWPNLRLELVGPDDGDMGRLQRLVSQAQLQDAVVFRGPLYGPSKYEFLASCTVVAAPCAFEIFGIATFEALSQGTPVVVADGSGGAALVAKSGAGLMANPNDPVAFGNALLAQMNLPSDARVGVQHFVRDFLSVDRYIDRVERLYHDVLRSHNQQHMLRRVTYV